MFKDRNEELQRLEQALLEDEEEEVSLAEEPGEEDESEEYDEEYDEDYEEDYDEEDIFPEYDYEDTRAAQDPVAYQHYSNGYRAYNSDDCDEDLDAFSEDVYEAEEERSNTGLVILACLLALGILGMVIFMLLCYGGIL